MPNPEQLDWVNKSHADDARIRAWQNEAQKAKSDGKLLTAGDLYRRAQDFENALDAYERAGETAEKEGRYLDAALAFEAAAEISNQSIRDANEERASRMRQLHRNNN